MIIRIHLLATDSTVFISPVWRWWKSRLLCCTEHCQAFLQPSDWGPPWQVHQVGSGLSWRWRWGLMALVLATFLTFVAKYPTGGNLGEDFEIVHSLKVQSVTVGKDSHSGEGHSGGLWWTEWWERGAASSLLCEPGPREGRPAFIWLLLSRPFLLSGPWAYGMVSFSFRRALLSSVNLLSGNALLDERGVSPMWLFATKINHESTSPV